MTHASTFLRPAHSPAAVVLCVLIGLCIGAVCAAGSAWASELEPLEVHVSPGEPLEHFGTYSNRSLRVAIEVDRRGARVLAFTSRDVPLVQPLIAKTAAEQANEERLRLEVILTDDDGRRHVRQVDAGPLCLRHDPEAEPHVAGDTIRLHRDSIVVELPELAGFDRLEVAHYPGGRHQDDRVILGQDRLDAARFNAAGTPLDYSSLAIAGATPAESKSVEVSSGVTWPEQLGDTEIYRIFGHPAAGASRVNITIVPDGYTFSDKALMETHAAQLVAAFRARSPYREHDPFINYTLVYAYSDQSGTDQCDCGTTVQTAMGTGFPAGTGACGASANRCLYYESGCDVASTYNIALAELRAPFHDASIVMVNTSRYGGCGGTRAVYSAGNAAATEIAIHELGHSLAGLADEYGGSASCGGSAGEINTSADGSLAAWPEWIDDLGPPVEGAQYYDHCLFRPTAQCQMRSLSQEFCSVCQQHWARVLLGHPRVRASAPIAALLPGPSLEASAGQPVELGVATRLPTGGAVNLIDWFIATPPEAEPRWVAKGSETLVHTFDVAGLYRVTARVIADAEVIKPERWDENVATASFDVLVHDAEAPEEVSPAGSPAPLVFQDAFQLNFGATPQGTGVMYNVYRGDLALIQDGTYGSCLAAGLAAPSLQAPETPPPGRTWCYLASAANPAGEGSLGNASSGDERHPFAGCE